MALALLACPTVSNTGTPWTWVPPLPGEMPPCHPDAVFQHLERMILALFSGGSLNDYPRIPVNQYGHSGLLLSPSSFPSKGGRPLRSCRT